MDKNMETMLTELKLEGMLEYWDDDIKQARKTKISIEKFIREILSREVTLKHDRDLKRRVKEASIPESWTMNTYPFARQPKLPKKLIMSIFDEFDFIEKHQNIIFFGPAGTGKSGLAMSFLRKAIHKGYRGKFITLIELLDLLYKSIADHTEARVLSKYFRYDCLVLDEVGYVTIEVAKANLLFRLLSGRHRKTSTIITTNLGFSEWPTFLGNTALSSALVDRLTQDTHIVQMSNCKSLRRACNPKNPGLDV